MIGLLDYGAGNVRSVANAIRHLGFSVREVRRPDEIFSCDTLVFPGVGNFGAVMASLSQSGCAEAVRQYIAQGRRFLGICVGLQTLFEESEESPGVAGLGVLKGRVRRFPAGDLSVPHMGWNGVRLKRPSCLLAGCSGEKFYFDHSFYVEVDRQDADAVLLETDYGIPFVSAVEKGRLAAVQFHPEKSGEAGLRFLRNFLTGNGLVEKPAPAGPTRMAKRIIACLDVREDDHGNLVVTKGDRYDVREGGKVRNLGDPVECARRYYEEGADEIVFLTITAFRQEPLTALPLLEMLRTVSGQVFVPLTIGGGIRPYTEKTGSFRSALDIASAYFRAGADKISIGSQAVEEAQEFLSTGTPPSGSSIRQISLHYGAQAVVVSVDPRRVYVSGPEETPHHTIRLPDGRYCWYQCTVRGGREARDIDARELCRTCERLGAGEILLNSIDADGTGAGFDLPLISEISQAVSIPVIASSGAGSADHFVEVFRATDAEAALAAGIFHRRKVTIQQVKDAMRAAGIPVR